jgi:murein DD-endopeptidase MepM/ murein hydrolase activator NlpD
MRILTLLLTICAAITPAAAMELWGNPVQGGMMIGRAAPGTEVEVAGKPVRVSPDGHFVFGFGRDFEGPVSLSIGGRALTVEVARRDYDIQRINGLPPKMVTPPPETLARIRRENAEIARVRALDTPAVWFADRWIWPVQGVVTGVFGSQRVLNGEPRRPHYGIDIAAAAGTPVAAPAGGVVRMAEPDLYFTGGTVMLDHGHGVTSVYSHLARIDVAAGDVLARGDVLGAVGSTGRSTGAHLDWRVNWFGERLDPALLAGPMPATDQ